MDRPSYASVLAAHKQSQGFPLAGFKQEAERRFVFYGNSLVPSFSFGPGIRSYELSSEHPLHTQFKNRAIDDLERLIVSDDMRAFHQASANAQSSLMAMDDHLRGNSKKHPFSPAPTTLLSLPFSGDAHTPYQLKEHENGVSLLLNSEIEGAYEIADIRKYFGRSFEKLLGAICYKSNVFAHKDQEHNPKLMLERFAITEQNGHFVVKADGAFALSYSNRSITVILDSFRRREKARTQA